MASAAGTGIVPILPVGFCPNVTTAILISGLLYLCFLYLTNNHNYWKIRGVPYEEPVFLAGSLLDVFKGKRQIGKHFGDLYKKFDGPYFGIFIIGQPYLVIRDPEIIKDITVKHFNNFDNRTFACDKEADDMTGNSLFVLRNPDWRNLRNKLSCVFTSGKLKGMFPLMRDAAEELRNYLDIRDGQILEFKEVSGKYMTDLVASCFFGFQADSFVIGKESEFRKICRKMFDIDLYHSVCLFSYFFAPKLVSFFKLKMFDTNYLKRVFLETVTAREKSGVKRNDFIDLLFDARDTLIDRNSSTQIDVICMVSQAITFLLAGFETTSNALAFTLYELCLRPDIQEKLREEINQYFPADDAEITLEKVLQMKYLDMVLSETLRRYPFGPFLNRECKEDYVIKETGLKIEKGTPILIPIDGIHFDEKYYPEPDKFEPERFRNGTKSFNNSCIYLPFGNGPRNCIGDRFGLICAKIGLVHILRHIKIQQCSSTPVPVELNPKSPFMTPINGLPMLVKRI